MTASVAPAGMVTLPEAAWKSLPAAAEPAVVVYETCTGSG